jgi:hypothetical protein
MLFDTKDQIKDRMVKTASRLWDIPESDIESNFDPLLILLFDACAAELEKTNRSIQATQSRLLDSMSEVLLPDAIMNVRPASCIIQAGATDIKTTIHNTQRFSFTNTLHQAGLKPYQAELSFTPIGSFNIYPTTLAYLYVGGRLLACTGGTQRSVIHDTKATSNTLVHELTLALNVEKPLTDIKGLQLFFDVRNHSQAGFFYDALKGATATFNNTPISIDNGYFINKDYELGIDDVLTDEGSGYTKKICRQTAWMYERHFLQITEALPFDSDRLPESWLQELPQPVTQKLGAEKLAFIRIQLSRPVPLQVMDRLVGAINAFPVINRNLHNLSEKTDGRMNIIPLPVDGDFLDVNNVYGPGGQAYKFRTAALAENLNEGEVIIRSSGVGKSSSAQLRALIAGVIDAVRDESAYFSRMSNDFVSSRLKEINKTLIRLEDKMELARDNKDTLHYLMLRPKKAGDTVTVEYWTVNKPEHSQQIKPDTKFLVHNNAAIKTNTVITLTNVAGARQGLTSKEKQYLLQRKITSDEKIVSSEDVKLLCFQLFGDMLQKVETKKAVLPGADRNSGFQTFIEVRLTVKQNTAFDETELLRRQLEYTLAQQASPVYPFRVVMV